jgi:hypothetical protein
MGPTDHPHRVSQTPMLAVQPSLFANSGRVENYPWHERPIDRLPYVMTNQGLRFDVEANEWNQYRDRERGKDTPARKQTLEKSTFTLDLNCYERSGPIGAMKRRVVVYLTQTSPRSKQWARTYSRLVDVPNVGAEGTTGSTLVTLYVRQADFYLHQSLIESHRRLFKQRLFNAA